MSRLDLWPGAGGTRVPCGREPKPPPAAALRAVPRAQHPGAHYPHKRKLHRTTIWKNSGIRVKDGRLLLSLAKGRGPLTPCPVPKAPGASRPVSLPDNLAGLPADTFVEMWLVYDRYARRYDWHLVVEDGRAPNAAPGVNVAGVDLGEIHPAAVSDGAETVLPTPRVVSEVGRVVVDELPRLGSGTLAVDRRR